MPIYTFRCRNGHDSDHFFYVDDKPASLDCPTCSEQAEHSIAATMRGALFQLTCDIEPHYNICVDRPVTSRRQWNEIKKRSEGKIDDYEKDSSRQSTDWQEKGKRTAAGLPPEGVIVNRPDFPEPDGPQSPFVLTADE